MCGIFGLWNVGGGPIDRDCLKAGTDSLRHRGPDDAGFLLVNSRSGNVVPCSGLDSSPSLGLPGLDEVPDDRYDLGFGFRRLAIFDPSPAGHQPMATQDGSHWIVFNGAIYNYLELRQELIDRGHQFHSRTDTEVILAAYKQWGPACLQRFNGMWAFAIWDVQRRELFLARDRFGVKPLYRCNDSRVLAFASEIKAFIASGAVSFQPSSSAVTAYLAFGRMPRHGGGETFFQGVSELPAGHHLTVQQNHDDRLSRYWRIEPGGSSLGPEAAVLAHQELFDDSVRLRLRADVRVGSCLSGGLDSSSIVATVGRFMRNDRAVLESGIGDFQQTFSAVYDIEGPWNEIRYIDSIAEATGVDSNTIIPTAERLWTEIENLTWHQDEPFQSTSIFAQWCVMDAVRMRGVKVLLDGQGADEVLGGYSLYQPFISGLLRTGQLRKAVSEARAMRSMGTPTFRTLAKIGWSQLPRLLPTRVLESKLRSIAADAPLSPHVAVEIDRDTIEEEFIRTRTLSGFLEHLTYEGTLPDFLRYEDRNSMAFSVEARVPFLDYRLVSLAFGRARSYRIRDGWPKWIHRMAMEDRLPKEVVWRRDKVGFATPQRQWLSSDGSQLIDRLRSSSLVREYLDVDRATAHLSSAFSTTDPNAPWRWVNLAVWLESMKTRSNPRSAS